MEAIPTTTGLINAGLRPKKRARQKCISQEWSEALFVWVVFQF